MMKNLTRRSFLSSASAAMAAEKRRPNIVVVLADDLGFGDLRSYNPESKIPTPHLDALAMSGTRFTDAHSPSAVCTPTRYGLLTGRYPWRSWLKEGVLDGFDPPLIEPERPTLASFLREAGYETACIGKWHLGMQWTDRQGQKVEYRGTSLGKFRPGDDINYNAEIQGGPLDRGFDSYFGISASLDMSPYCFIENRRVVGEPSVATPEQRSLMLNQAAGRATPGFRLEDVLPRCMERAVKYVAQRGNAAQPYFLYLPLSAPHLPVVPNRPYQGKSRAGAYGDFVVEMDAGIGQLLQALRETGQAEDTLVLFSSDNGSLWHWWDFQETDDRAAGKPTARSEEMKRWVHQGNGPLRGTKADVWEGGHRVPLLAAWPRFGLAGNVSTSLICLTDVFATCAEIVGRRLPTGAEDSCSFLGALRGKRTRRREAVLASHRGLLAMRMDHWKFVPARGSGGFSSPRTIEGTQQGQLYNLREDLAETRNLITQYPKVVRKLVARLEAVAGRDAVRQPL